MNRIFTTAFLAVVLVASVSTDARARRVLNRGEVIPSRQPQTVAGTIGSFVDGDTFWLLRADGTRIKVREWIADCAEISRSKKEVDQPDSREALKYSTEHYKGKEVTVTIKGHSYDRIVGSTLPKGAERTIGLDLVSVGHAAVYPKATPRPTQAFLDSEKQAKEKRLGIWGQESPVMPWTWRAEHRKKLIER